MLQRVWVVRPDWLTWIQQNPLRCLLLLAWSLNALPVAVSWLYYLTQQPLDTVFIPTLTTGVLTWSAWQQRHTLSWCERIHWLPVLCFLMLWAVYSVSDFFSVQSVVWASFIALSTCLAWALTGKRQTNKLLPLSGLAFYLLPVVHAELVNTVSIPLQWVSATTSAWLVGLFTTIYQAGTLLAIDGMLFNVAPACCGLNSWLSFLYVCFLWQAVEGARIRNVLLCIPLTLVLALVLNIVRITLMLVIAQATDEATALALHTNLDYLLFPLGLLALFLLAKRSSGLSVSQC